MSTKRRRNLLRDCVQGLLVLPALFICLSHVADGGTIRNDQPDALYLNLAIQSQFASVGRHNGPGVLCSGTLIHEQWVLTAAHCVDLNGDGFVDNPGGAGNSFFTSTGLTVGVSEIHVPAGWNGNLNDGFDIALMKLAVPVSGIAPAAIYRGVAELASTVTMVGYGMTGTGQTGASLSAGTRRAGENTIDGFGQFLGLGDIGVTTSNAPSNSALVWDFDSPLSDPFHANTNTMQSLLGIPSSDVPNILEYSLAPGDSGGGNFIFEGGKWWLAGVSSGIANTFSYPGAEAQNRSTYGDLNLVTRVSSYQSFIDGFVPAASVPEPATLTGVLFLLGAAVGWRNSAGKRPGSSSENVTGSCVEVRT